MLQTPLGEILILVDGQSVNYEPIALECTEYGTHYGTPGVKSYEVDARCKIEAELSSIPCVVECKLNNYSGDGRGVEESGQYLALISFSRGNTKLSIGTEDEIPGVECGYTDYGLKVELTERASIRRVTFGIAWLSMNDEEQEYSFTNLAVDFALYER